MPLPTFDSKDKIPEAVRDGYVEKEGRWVPDVEDVSGLKAAQKKALDEKKQLEDRLRSTLGDHKLEDVGEWLKKRTEEEEAAAKRRGDVDGLVEKRVKAVRDELEPKVTEGEKAKQALANLQFEIGVRDAAGDSGINPKKMGAVMKIVRDDHIKTGKDGKLVVVDADGDPTGQTVEKFFAETFKKLYPEFYLATGSSGGGSSGGSGERRSPNGAVAITDTAGLLANLDGVASGKVKVNY